MSHLLSRSEFAILTYMHEHAEQFDEEGRFGILHVSQATALPQKEVTKAVSALAGLGLVGVASEPWVTFGNQHLRFLHLTSAGEQSMRRAEEVLAAQIDEASEEAGEHADGASRSRSQA